MEIKAGHSPKKEKKVARILYIAIAAVVIVAAILFFSSRNKIKDSAESPATPVATDTELNSGIPTDSTSTEEPGTTIIPEEAEPAPAGK